MTAADRGRSPLRSHHWRHVPAGFDGASPETSGRIYTFSNSERFKPLERVQTWHVELRPTQVGLQTHWRTPSCGLSAVSSKKSIQNDTNSVTFPRLRVQLPKTPHCWARPQASTETDFRRKTNKSTPPPTDEPYLLNEAAVQWVLLSVSIFGWSNCPNCGILSSSWLRSASLPRSNSSLKQFIHRVVLCLGPPHPPVSPNLSQLAIEQPSIISTARLIMKSSGYPARHSIRFDLREWRSCSKPSA